MKIKRKKRYSWQLILTLLVVAIGIGCLAGLRVGERLLAEDAAKEPQPQTPAKADSAEKVMTEADYAKLAGEIAAGMSDEQKAGQLIMIGVPGQEIDADTEQLMQYCQPGGIILFDRNLENPSQAKQLVAGLNSLNQTYQPVPLFIGIDEEGGQVARMKDYLTVMPSAAELGNNASPNRAADYAAKTARELQELGINLNFAPVADLGLAKERSYSKSPEAVANYVQAIVRAYNREGLLCSLKHFPGIGKAKVDPHLDTSQISAVQTVLEKEDFVPFASTISNINNDAFMVMVSHLKYPALDKQYPASVSPKINTELLRNKLGYKGIIITDDMEMGGIANLYSFEEMGYMALKAGADIVLICHEPEHQRLVYEGIVQAIKDGRLNKTIVEDKVRRIITVKLKYLINKKTSNN